MEIQLISMIWMQKIENKDTQKYIENHNQEYNETDIQKETDFGRQE